MMLVRIAVFSPAQVWLPKHIAIKADARIALLKSFRVDEDFAYSDYKKFRSDTKIVGLEEVPVSK